MCARYKDQGIEMRGENLRVCLDEKKPIKFQVGEEL